MAKRLSCYSRARFHRHSIHFTVTIVFQVKCTNNLAVRCCDHCVEQLLSKERLPIEYRMSYTIWHIWLWTQTNRIRYLSRGAWTMQYLSQRPKGFFSPRDDSFVLKFVRWRIHDNQRVLRRSGEVDGIGAGLPPFWRSILQSSASWMLRMRR